MNDSPNWTPSIELSNIAKDDFSHLKFYEGIVFFPIQTALWFSFCIAELQEVMIDSVTFQLPDFVVIRGKHELFVKEYRYYDAYFITDPQTNQIGFHSFQPTIKPSNVNETDISIN